MKFCVDSWRLFYFLFSFVNVCDREREGEKERERHFPLAHTICPTLQADACAVKGFRCEVIWHICVCACVCVFECVAALSARCLFFYALLLFFFASFCCCCCCCFLISFHVYFCRHLSAGKSELILLFSQQQQQQRRREWNLANASCRSTTTSRWSSELCDRMLSLSLSPVPCSLPPFPHSLSLFANTPRCLGVCESFAILIGDVGMLKMDLYYIVSHTRQERREQICTRKQHERSEKF